MGINLRIGFQRLGIALQAASGQQPWEHQRGGGPVSKEVVPLDGGTNEAREGNLPDRSCGSCHSLNRCIPVRPCRSFVLCVVLLLAEAIRARGAATLSCRTPWRNSWCGGARA